MAITDSNHCREFRANGKRIPGLTFDASGMKFEAQVG